ncbi:MAG: Ig-like domain-containing protein, partial [Gemmatimonadaceae bacterium]|nr:Ig-like domain-containing protein [Gemmatimonadaceae bacterium]
MRLVALLALLQQPPAAQPAPPAPAVLPRPAKIEISPEKPVMFAQDTLRLTARVVDAQGQPIPQATIRWLRAGGAFEGAVRQDGLVESGATGTLPVIAVATVQGYSPINQRVEVQMVAGPAARIALSSPPARLVVGQRVRLDAGVFSAAGDKRAERPAWRSSSAAIATVTSDGLVQARAPGRVTLTATAGQASTTHSVQVVANTITSLALTPATADGRTGDVIRFTLAATDAAGRAITGLTPTWSFSPGQGIIDQDGAFVGYEPGSYTVTASLGTRSADAVITLRRRDVRREAQVVGRLPRQLFTTEEVWLHPTRKIAYLGTGSGGDRMYAIDISNPANPVVTDSIVENTRRVNDIMTTPDGSHLVFTREGAADRKNGIVIASLDDPLHPKKCADFTDGVTSGVHSAFVYRQAKHGTHVYLTNDGTGAFHILDINDPCQPKQVAMWKTPRPEAGRTLHDVDVQDGLAY